MTVQKEYNAMKSALLDAFPRADGKAMRQTALMTFLLVLAAHAFCFLNLTFSGASVMFNAAKGADAQIASGVYLQPFYWRVRGAVSVPILVGLLSAAALSLTGALLSALLGIKRLPLCAMLAGALALSPAVLVAFAGSVHTADALFLAMLLAACAAALCLRIRVGFMPASLLLAAGQALDPAAFAFFAGVVLIALIQALSDSEESGRLCALRALGGLLCGLLGSAVYAGGYILLTHHYGIDAQAFLQSGTGLFDRWRYPVSILFAPLTIYPHAGKLLSGILLVIGAAALLTLILRIRKNPLRALCMLALTVALPLALNLPFFSSEQPPQVAMPFCLLTVLLIVLLQDAVGITLESIFPAVAALLGLSLLGTTIFANQVYLKKALEYDSTLSVMTRVLTRAEAVSGYKPGETPTAIIGTLDCSELSVTHDGFEALTVLDAAKNNFAPTDDAGNLWYMWDAMGYPFNFVSTYELEQYKAREDVQAMPAFPAAGCCQLIDGVLVVKLSDAS